MKVIDLFSGVGGLSEGFKMAGANIILANEIDEEIAESYSRNHPSTKLLREDITKVDIEEIFSQYSDIDIIVGGPPCQGFSQKGKRLLMDDPRNFLFRYFFNVVGYVKPKYFLIENVPNMLTSQDGYFKNEIEDLFEGIGYNVNSTILDASDYGVPQRRRRAFIIGRLGNKKLRFPIAKSKKVTIWDAISDLNYLESGEGSFVQDYLIEPQSEYQEKMRQSSIKLYNHKATNHSKLAIERMKLIPINGGREDLPKEHRTKSIYSGTWSRLRKNEQSVTITTRFDTPSSGRFTHPILDRAITVREAARLQSFPDKFIFYGTKMSQMKQVGNAVPPIMAKEIAEIIKLDMEG